jgi:RimJ/RimL family protein N-acetyltransferase
MCLLRKLDFESLTKIWEQGRHDPDWPLSEVTHAALKTLVMRHLSAELLGFGLIRGIEVNQQLVGFITLNKIDESWLRPATTAVEGGTYILPSHRGRGFNLPVKQAMLQMAYNQLDSQWCVFLVPKNNQRAQRALANLPQTVHVETIDNPLLFRRLLRRKSWEVSKELILYGFRRDAD